MKKQTMTGCLTLGVALGVAAIAQMPQTAQAADAPAMMAKPAMAQPMLVTGKVNNYWTDASGYVTGVDLQTANGPAVVHFVPGMGTMLSQTYPIGSTADLWVQGSMMDGTQHWDLVGVGSKMPAAGFWPVWEMNGLDIAEDWPQIVNGAERVTVEGKLKRVAVDKKGKVIGLIVDTKKISKGSAQVKMKLFSGDLTRGETIWESTTGGAPNWTLIRVGPEVGNNQTVSDDSRVTNIVLNDEIIATGYMEAPRYGAVSPYGQRLIASGIIVNSASVGPLGFPKMRASEPTILGLNLKLPLITGMPAATLQAVPGGYEVYNGPGGAMVAK